MLTTTGAKSGRRHTLPLVALPEDDRIMVIASNYGQQRNPSWYYNLRAHPAATIVFEGDELQVTARELEGEERERLYARGIEIYPGWEQYRKRASHRQIPVIELTPVEVAAHDCSIWGAMAPNGFSGSAVTLPMPGCSLSAHAREAGDGPPASGAVQPRPAARGPR